MAMGARKAFEELPEGPARDRWLSLPYLGCDGLPNSGQAWVRRGSLAATVYIPPNAGKGLEMLVEALNTGSMPEEKTITIPISFPPIDTLSASQKARGRSAGKS